MRAAIEMRKFEKVARLFELTDIPASPTKGGARDRHLMSCQSIVQSNKSNRVEKRKSASLVRILPLNRCGCFPFNLVE